MLTNTREKLTKISHRMFHTHATTSRVKTMSHYIFTFLFYNPSTLTLWPRRPVLHVKQYTKVNTSIRHQQLQSLEAVFPSAAPAPVLSHTITSPQPRKYLSSAAISPQSRQQQSIAALKWLQEKYTALTLLANSHPRIEQLLYYMTHKSSNSS